MQQSECWPLQVRGEEGALLSEARAQLQASVQQQVHGEREALLAQARAAAAEASAMAEPGPPQTAGAAQAGGAPSHVLCVQYAFAAVGLKSQEECCAVLTGQRQKMLACRRDVMALSASLWSESCVDSAPLQGNLPRYKRRGGLLQRPRLQLCRA